MVLCWHCCIICSFVQYWWFVLLMDLQISNRLITNEPYGTDKLDLHMLVISYLDLNSELVLGLCNSIMLAWAWASRKNQDICRRCGSPQKAWSSKIFIFLMLIWWILMLWHSNLILKLNYAVFRSKWLNVQYCMISAANCISLFLTGHLSISSQHSGCWTFKVPHNNSA